MRRAHVAGIVVTLLAIGAGVVIGSRSLTSSPAGEAPRSRASTPSPKAGLTPFSIPRASGPITIDGELDDPGWTRRSARTNAFLGEGGAAGRPYADARLAWDDTTLYIALYAGDRDVRAAKAAHDGPLWLGGDEFRLVFVDPEGARVVLEVSPSCVVTDARAPAGGKLDYAWESGARVACDVDGTIDDPSDEDEEWVVEIAIPLASLSRSRAFSFGARRCDASRDGTRRCTTWHDDGPVPVTLDE